MDFKHIGLEKYILYEVLATTISIESHQIVPNTACMGVRLLDDNLILIKPYPTTKTFHNIKKLPIVILNFTDDIRLYAIMSLKNPKINYDYKNSPESQYDFLEVNISAVNEGKLKVVPFIKNSWAIIVCKVEKENIKQKKDQFGVINLSEFLLNPIFINKFRESYKLYNRAENLILESIILTTRLKIALEMQNQNLIKQFEHKIIENIETINKFNTDEKISKIIEYLNQYIQKLKD